MMGRCDNVAEAAFVHGGVAAGGSVRAATAHTCRAGAARSRRRQSGRREVVCGLGGVGEHGARNREAAGATVYLVGTGPGDPELLTLKAVRLMQSADVILYDRLVSHDILQLASPSALLIYVGKQKGMHTRTQSEIHELLQFYASQPGISSVLRLKGGDPYVFGRGGEEAEYLRACGKRVVAVPGITSAAGIGAELGIPLTHRGVATSCRFATGHLKDGMLDAESSDQFASLSVEETLVVYMGLGAVDSLTRALLNNGVPENTAVAAVERGTTPDQRVVFCELHEVAARVAAAELASPTLLIIGGVVKLSPGWNHRHRAIVFDAFDVASFGTTVDSFQSANALAALDVRLPVFSREEDSV